MKRIAYFVAALVSLGLLVAAGQQWLPMTLTEVLGFITGAGLRMADRERERLELAGRDRQ